MPLTEPVPGVKPDCSEYQRWLAAPPIICPFNAYVYQATNNECCCGLMSTSKPWPLVAGSYHAPDNRYDGGDCPPPAVVQETLPPSRVSGIEPLRPLPSVNAYVNVPCVQSLNASVA